MPKRPAPPATRSFDVYMEMFDPVDQPSGFDTLPRAFGEAKKLLDLDADANFAAAAQLLRPYLRARFGPRIFDSCHGDQLFPDLMADTETEDVELRRIIFGRGHYIPTVSAAATLRVPVKPGFDDVDLDEWQENNAPLVDALSFAWDIPRNEATEKLEYFSGDNGECEITATQEKSKKARPDVAIRVTVKAKLEWRWKQFALKDVTPELSQLYLVNGKTDVDLKITSQDLTWDFTPVSGAKKQFTINASGIIMVEITARKLSLINSNYVQFYHIRFSRGKEVALSGRDFLLWPQGVVGLELVTTGTACKKQRTTTAASPKR